MDLKRAIILLLVVGCAVAQAKTKASVNKTGTTSIADEYNSAAKNYRDAAESRLIDNIRSLISEQRSVLGVRVQSEGESNIRYFCDDDNTWYGITPEQLRFSVASRTNFGICEESVYTDFLKLYISIRCHSTVDNNVTLSERKQIGLIQDIGIDVYEDCNGPWTP